MTFRPFAIGLLLAALVLGACGPMHKQVTERDRQTATSYYQLALNYYTGNQVIEALQSLKDAVAYNPRDSQVQNLYGLIYLGKHMLPEAEKSFKAALESDPKFSDASLNLAAVYMAQEKWALALGALKLPAEDLLYRDKDKVFDNMGWCYFKLGKLDEALVQLNRATMENDKFCHAWFNLGLVYMELKRYPNAVSAFGKLTTHCGEYAFGYYQLAQAALKAGDPGTARTALEKCIVLGGTSNEALSCKEQLKALGGAMPTVPAPAAGPDTHLGKPTNL